MTPLLLDGGRGLVHGTFGDDRGPPPVDGWLNQGSGDVVKSRLDGTSGNTHRDPWIEGHPSGGWVRRRKEKPYDSSLPGLKDP